MTEQEKVHLLTIKVIDAIEEKCLTEKTDNNE